MIKTRKTRQRDLILKELRRMKTHPTSDEVFTAVRESMPRISLGTVYRNLDLLAKSGEILCLEGTPRRYDGDMTPHRHARCIICGCVADIFDDKKDVQLDENMHVEGFSRLTGVQVQYEGICLKCAAKAEESAAAIA